MSFIVGLVYFLFTGFNGQTLEADAQSFHERGRLEYEVGNYERAVDLFFRAASLRSDVPNYRFFLGLSYLKIGEAKKATEEFEATLGMIGLQRDTRLKEPIVLSQAGIAYLHLGDQKTARKRLELAIERDPSLSNAHYVLGVVEKSEGNEKLALSSFYRVLELDRDHPLANVAVSDFYQENGRIKEAREALRHATHGDPDNFEIYTALGVLAYQDGDLEEADSAFQLALRLNPGSTLAIFNMGTIRLRQGYFREAIELLRPIAIGSPSHDAGTFHLAQALRQIESYEEGHSYMTALLDRNPYFPGASFLLGLLSEELNDKEAAEAAYRSSIEHQPDLHGAYLNLAGILEQTERIAEAIEVLESCLQLELSKKEVASIRESIKLLEGTKNLLGTNSK